MAKLTLVVIRVTRDGELSESKPCRECCAMIRSMGIKRVVYTRNSSELTIERGQDISSDHLSRFARHGCC